VLLKNAGSVLPLRSRVVKSLAVIGDDAGPRVTVMESGSGRVYVDPAHLNTPSDAIKARAGAAMTVAYAAGTRGIARLPPLPGEYLRTASGRTGFDGAYWRNTTLSGTPVFTRVDSGVDFDAPPSELTDRALGRGVSVAPGTGFAWSAKWTGTLTPPSTGIYRFSVAGGGTAQLYVDHRTVVSLMRADFGMVAHGTIALTAGRTVPIELKFSNESNLTGQYLHLGWTPPEPNLLRDAVAAAQRADAAIVFASEQEGEGYDKLSLPLPGDQDSLIDAVASANPRTIVVLHTSNPVAMPWLGKVAAVVQAWYPGQEAGVSIASVLFGDVNPSGKLPMTFPADESQGPATKWTEYPGDGRTVDFSEGVLVGYRL
jgi:beta-glucosidase